MIYTPKGGRNMSENNTVNKDEKAKKKVSLKEAIQKQLEAKKNKSSNQNFVGSSAQSATKMKSQQSKKVNSTPRKMGS